MFELKQFLKSRNEILLLTETHMTHNKIKFDTEIKTLHKMRETTDKKGGGLCIMVNKKESSLKISEKATNHQDILNINVEDNNFTMNIILIYMSVINKPEDKQRNIKIKKALEEALEDNGHATLVIGDFNGHIEEIGYQKENNNGKIMKNIIERYNLSMLNLNDNCTGKNTWQRQDQKSTIDYALANEELLRKFKKMIIDEEREKFDLSDHSLIEIYITKGKNEKEAEENNLTKTYLSYKEDDLVIFVNKVNDFIDNNPVNNFTQLNHLISKTSEEVLRKKFIKRGVHNI